MNQTMYVLMRCCMTMANQHESERYQVFNQAKWEKDEKISFNYSNYIQSQLYYLG